MHPDVAFFDIKAPPDSTVMAMNNPMAADPSIDLQFDNCIMRGEATLLRTLQMQSGQLLQDLNNVSLTKRSESLTWRRQPRNGSLLKTKSSAFKTWTGF